MNLPLSFIEVSEYETKARHWINTLLIMRIVEFDDSHWRIVFDSESMIVKKFTFPNLTNSSKPREILANDSSHKSKSSKKKSR